MIRWKIRGEGTGKARKIDKKIKKKKKYPISLLFTRGIKTGVRSSLAIQREG